MGAGLKSGVARGFGRLSDRGGGSAPKGAVLLFPPGVDPGNGWLSENESMRWDPAVEPLLARSFLSKLQTVPTVSNMSGGVASDGRDCFIVAMQASRIRRSLDGGATWEVVLYDTSIPSSNISAIVYNPDNDTFSFLVTIDVNTRAIYTSADKGLTWVRTNLPLTGGINWVGFTYSGGYYWLGNTTTSGATARAYFTQDLAATWSTYSVESSSLNSGIYAFAEMAGKVYVFPYRGSQGGGSFGIFDLAAKTWALGTLPSTVVQVTEAVGTPGGMLIKHSTGTGAIALDGTITVNTGSVQASNIIWAEGRFFAKVNSSFRVRANSNPLGFSSWDLFNGADAPATGPLAYARGRFLAAYQNNNIYTWGDMEGIKLTLKPPGKADWVAWTRYE